MSLTRTFENFLQTMSLIMHLLLLEVPKITAGITPMNYLNHQSRIAWRAIEIGSVEPEYKLSAADVLDDFMIEQIDILDQR